MTSLCLVGVIPSWQSSHVAPPGHHHLLMQVLPSPQWGNTSSPRPHPHWSGTSVGWSTDWGFPTSIGPSLSSAVPTLLQPQWFYRLMYLNMASVLHYCNQPPILPTPLTSCGNLELTVQAHSHQQNKDIPKLKMKLWLLFMHSKSLTNFSLASLMSLFSDHKPLETIFKHPLAAAPRRLLFSTTHSQLSTARGQQFTLPTLSLRPPLPTTSHKQVYDELVCHVEFEAKKPWTFWLPRCNASGDKNCGSHWSWIFLWSHVEAGWPNDKTAVPELACPYWTICHELTSHDGLLFKQDRVIVPSSAHPTILHQLYAAHHGPEFTIQHARRCVFWPGINSQVTDICRNCVICAQYRHQHPRKPLQPYPGPTLPWAQWCCIFGNCWSLQRLLWDWLPSIYSVFSCSESHQATFWLQWNSTLC